MSRILNKDFVYTKAIDTDIRKTFRRFVWKPKERAAPRVPDGTAGKDGVSASPSGPAVAARRVIPIKAV